MTAVPLTPAEQAAAEALAVAEFDSELTLINEGSREEVARAVVAAVSSLIEAEILDLSAADLEALADRIRRTHAAAQPNRPGLEVAAKILRERAAAFRAQSLSRPTSEETPDGL